MIKTKTVETVEEFDEGGRLLKRTVTEREETDDKPVQYVYTSSPYMPYSCGGSVTWPSADPDAGDAGGAE